MRDGEPSRSRTLIFYAAAGGALFVDQVSKLLARAYLPQGKSVTLISGFFDLRLTFNTGAAFGLLPDWAPFFIIAALVVIFAIAKFRRSGGSSQILSVGLGLLLGGAVGNLIDRLSSPDRAVTDFLSFHVRVGGKSYAWPTFNVADAAIVVGALLMLYHVYVVEKRRTGQQ